MKKIYITSKELLDCLVQQNATGIQYDNKGAYIMGWTQGIAAIDLHNSNNNATYLCWYAENDSPEPVGIKAYFNQFKEDDEHTDHL